MKNQAKYLTAILAASVSLSAYGCGSKEVEPPVPVGQSVNVGGKVDVSVVSFEKTRPIFVDDEKNVYRLRKDETVAVLTLKFRNTTSEPVSYKPLHNETGNRRVQLTTAPDPEKGAPYYGRIFMNPVKADGATRAHATNQIVTSGYEIPAGGEITDAYLFENPTASGLIALVPGDSVGSSEILKLAVGDIKTVEPPAPAKINESVSVEGVSIAVNKVTTEYPELAPRAKPAKELKYAYAYTADPVMAIHVTIKNGSDKQVSYIPSHEAESIAVSLTTATGENVKRAKIGGTVTGKDQVQGTKVIEPGASLDDVFYFSVPSDSVTLDFSLAGKIVGVYGLYEYRLDYEKTTPQKPDLEPYKNAGNGDNAKDDAAKDEDAQDGDGQEDEE